MTRPSLNEILAKGSASFRRANAGAAGVLPANVGAKAKPDRNLDAGIPDTGAKRDAAPALDKIQQPQTGNVGAPSQRPRVEFTLFRSKLLDPDSKTASVKPVLDGLVAAGLIPDDREADIELRVEQEKVPLSREGTGIVITYPANAKK